MFWLKYYQKYESKAVSYHESIDVEVEAVLIDEDNDRVEGEGDGQGQEEDQCHGLARDTDIR